MKNLKNILATLVLVTVMGVSTSFGSGVYAGDRADQGCTKVATFNTGILVAGFTVEGILVAGLEGLIMSDRATTPCRATEGILVAG